MNNGFNCDNSNTWICYCTTTNKYSSMTVPAVIVSVESYSSLFTYIFFILFLILHLILLWDMAMPLSIIKHYYYTPNSFLPFYINTYPYLPNYMPKPNVPIMGLLKYATTLSLCVCMCIGFAILSRILCRYSLLSYTTLLLVNIAYS